MADIEIPKKFSGQKSEHLATTTSIEEAEDLIKKGWKLFDSASFPANSSVGGMVFVTIFILTKE